MKFSFEVPIHSIKELDSEQDYLFILAHHLNNGKYFEYCKNSSKYKILDNGAYEKGKSIDGKKLLSLAIDIKADAIIIPDVLFDKKESQKIEKKFLKLIAPLRSNFKLMKVVCGNSLEEYLESLVEVAEDDICDIIGISQSRSMIAPNLSFCMNYLYDRAEKPKAFIKPIHLLGCTNPFELVEARMHNQIESIDTGRPINFTFANKLFPKLLRNMDYKKVSGYDIDIKKKLNISLAKKNIKIFKSYYE